MKDTAFIAPINKRILIITGHYGSGKTEFSVSLALKLAENNVTGYKRIALVDLDIVNPYFRSRERKELLEKAGISVYGDFFGGDITAEIPALSADFRTPLEDKDCFTIIDVGGNDAGARTLHQLDKYLNSGEHLLLSVVNANRPGTGDIEGATEHLTAIEYELGTNIDGIISNCHLITETTADTVKKGHYLCTQLSEITGKPLFCDCYPEPLVDPSELSDIDGYKMPLGMYLRERWLDK